MPAPTVTDAPSPSIFPFDAVPTWPILKQVRAILDQLFAIPPGAIQQYEVAALTFAVMLFQLHLSQAQIAQYASIGLAVYLGAKTLVTGFEQLAKALSTRVN